MSAIGRWLSKADRPLPASSGLGQEVRSPYEAKGLVASLALGFQLPRYAFVPPIAFTVKPSYAFDLDRWGVEVPIYLFSEAEGKLSSGVKITCKGDGRTQSGILLEDECGAALFVGTKFKVGGAP